MSEFFQTLQRAMRDKESFSFTVTREGDQLKLVCQPLLGKLDDDFDEDEKDDGAQLRAALAMPILLRDAPAALDESFGGKFQRFQEARAPIASAFEATLETIKEAGKRATAKSTGKAATKASTPPAAPPKPAKAESKKAEVASEAPAAPAAKPEAPAAVANPPSLF